MKLGNEDHRKEVLQKKKNLREEVDRRGYDMGGKKNKVALERRKEEKEGRKEKRVWIRR